MLESLIKGVGVDEEIHSAIRSIHLKGPSDPAIFEKLAYIKKFHSGILEKYEGKLISIMGLFYKSEQPESLLEEVYSIYSDSIKDSTGSRFTPVQASAYRYIKNERYFSFSAPTSAGKSYLFRELIKTTQGDIIIVVPSRALISEYYYEVVSLVDKNVLVLQFIDDINTDNIDRRIYIITPERGVELFKYANDLNIELFLLDEAQISEEPVRGMRFDSFVRRIDKVFPSAKKVFAHPFVINPGAQLSKHGFDNSSCSMNYDFHAVGKIYLSFDKGCFEYFSPNENVDHVTEECDVAYKALSSGGSLLVYISKRKIYDGFHIAEFNKYVDICPKLDDPDAIAIIEKLRDFIGASSDGVEKHSYLLEMMEKGVVIHHGSMPLKARLLIEDFIKSNFAKLCFATSTLSQGVNMPFDVVWIDNFTRMEPLALKNLIGRSGRTTLKKSSLDYGYVILKKENVKTFKKRYKESVSINEISLLDEDMGSVSDDLKDIVEALKDDSFDDELHITDKQLERIESADVDTNIKYILDKLLVNDVPITGKAYYEIGDGVRRKIKSSFNLVYIQHLRRSELIRAEKNVLSTAIPILLWRVQGKSFSEIVSLRYSFLSERNTRRNILAKMKRQKISAEQANKEIRDIKVRFSQIPKSLPDSTLQDRSLYSGISIADLDFDMVVYDTYDYLDKVISQSLVDPLCAAFEVYYRKTGDDRATILKNHVRYGTNDDLEIWLLRYGFGFEEIEWIKEYIECIDSKKIVFKDEVKNLVDDRLEVISRYL